MESSEVKEYILTDKTLNTFTSTIIHYTIQNLSIYKLFWTT